MSWKEKSEPTDFDSQPIEGMFFLDGDAVFNQLGAYWVAGLKFPMIEFPSGIQRQIWETSAEKGGIVHVFGEMDLPYYSSFRPYRRQQLWGIFVCHGQQSSEWQALWHNLLWLRLS